MDTFVFTVACSTALSLLCFSFLRHSRDSDFYDINVSSFNTFSSFNYNADQKFETFALVSP